MKRSYIFFVILVIFVFLSCSKSGVIEFCREVDKHGNGQKCGKKFTLGELKIIINAESSFGAEKITIKKMDLNSKTYSESKEIKVDAMQTKSNTDLSFYRSGKYKITAEIKNEKVVAEGEIEIIDDNIE